MKLSHVKESEVPFLNKKLAPPLTYIISFKFCNIGFNSFLSNFVSATLHFLTKK